MAPQTTTVKPNFKQWMRLVDAACYEKAGMSYQDLEDYGYAAAYANGKTPKATAAAAIKAARNS